MLLLGIETSCDETAAAVVENGRKILSNVVSSQIDIHARFGGVVPEVASRQHVSAVIPVIDEALRLADTHWEGLSAIAVTHGPGLAGSLLVGVSTARPSALGGSHWSELITLKPTFMPTGGRRTLFPLLCLIVSGGRTDLILMKDHGDYTLLGNTCDDAAGEAFDKAARILGLGYPGGPAIEKAAKSAETCLKLPRAWLKDTADFSFSGLKTALLRLAETGEAGNIPKAAAGFQEAVVEVLVKKTVDAATTHKVKQILLSGGVAANSFLRQQMAASAPVPVRAPPPSLCTDNAAMVAACGYQRFQAGHINNTGLDVIPSLTLV